MLTSYTEAYGRVFVWHAVLGTVAWVVLAPLGHILAKLQRAQSPSRAFEWHRLLMAASAGLTAVTFAIGALFADGRAPVIHQVLGSVLLGMVALQVGAGVMRPEKKAGWRRLWKRMHALSGVSVMALGGYLVQHSTEVFDVGDAVRRGVTGGVLVAGMAIGAVHLWGRGKGEEKERDGMMLEEEERMDREEEEEGLLGAGEWRRDER